MKYHLIGIGLGVGKRYTFSLLRVAQHLTKSELVRRTGMSESDISRFERGDHGLSTAKRYAEAIGGKLEVAVMINGRCYAIDVDQTMADEEFREAYKKVIEQHAETFRALADHDNQYEGDE